MIYELVWSAPAKKQLRKLDPQVCRGIIMVVGALAHDPRPPGAIKLTNRPGWRVRWRDWRVIYDIDDDVVTVKVMRVGSRSNRNKCS